MLYRLLAFLIFIAATPTACAQNQTSDTGSPVSNVVYLWENGAPNFENNKDIPERAQDWWVRDIHNPSLTTFTPTSNLSRTAVIVVAGGGHKDLVFNSEGIKPAKYLQENGITAFALKYRLARELNSPYDIETDAAEDLRRAIRWVRAHAEDYNIDPDRIGVMAFSAGGELANLVTYYPNDGDAMAVDPVERVSARPDFMIQIYPGPIGMPDHLSTPPPPAFFLAAFDDTGPELTISRHLQMYRQAGVPAEVHIFAQGGHAFNMGDRSNLETISNWRGRLTDWLKDSGYLEPTVE